MNTDAIVRHIANMKKRDNVNAILQAAEQRDMELMEHASYRMSKRVFAAYAHLKRGDIVYVHATKVDRKQEWMRGKPLTVWAVHPRDRALQVRTNEMERVVEKTGKRVRVLDHLGKPKLDPATGKSLWRAVTRTVERPRSYLMRWSVLEKLKVSEKPTAAALAYSLSGGQS